MADVSDQAEQLGRRANDHEWMDRGIRFGMVCYGIVYLLVAWLALQLALGHQSANASNKGALQMLGKQTFGPVLLWLVAIGLAVLVLWRALEALVGHQEYDGGKRTRKRLMSAGKAVIYGYVAYLAFRYAIGAGSSGTTDSTTAKLMDQPFGRFLVGSDRRGHRGVRRGTDPAWLDREVHGQPRRPRLRRRRRQGLPADRQDRLHRQGHRVHPHRRPVRRPRPSPITPRSRATSTRPSTPCSTIPSARSSSSSSRPGSRATDSSASRGPATCPGDRVVDRSDPPAGLGCPPARAARRARTRRAAPRRPRPVDR